MVLDSLKRFNDKYDETVRKQQQRQQNDVSDIALLSLMLTSSALKARILRF